MSDINKPDFQEYFVKLPKTFQIELNVYLKTQSLPELFHMKPLCQNSSRQKNIYDRILPFKENCMPEFFHTKTKVLLYSVCLRPKYMLGLLENFLKIPLAPMGVLAHGSAHA